MSRCYFHVDLDAFFASVEQRDNPELKGKPVIVGAQPGHRGVVSTCSYEARAYGVHSAMPISEAYKRCRHGIFLPVRMRRYAEVSRLIIETLKEFTPDVRQLSIDEAALDMTGTERLWGEAERAARMLKARVLERSGLTISVGVGSNPYIAKVASGIGKPDGLTVVASGREADFMRKLPIEKLWGAGEKTRALLASAGLRSIAAIQDENPRMLKRTLGAASASFLRAAAMGLDPGIYSQAPKSRSISGERTFEHDTADRQLLLDTLRLLADELSARCYDSSLSSCTLALKLRFGDFTTVTRQSTRPDPYRSSDDIYDEAVLLLDENWDGHALIRLLGLGLHGVGEEETPQGLLFEEGASRSEEMRRAAQEISRKAGAKIVRARFLDPKEKNSRDR